MTMSMARPPSAPTAILKAGNVPLPASVVVSLGFSPGELIDIFIPDKRRIVARRASPGSSGKQLTVSWPANNSFRYGRKVLASAGLEVGEVVAFDLVGKGELGLSAIDPLQDPLYLHPVRDNEGRPLPPGWLAQAFTSSPDLDGFMKTGQLTAEILSTWARECGLPLSDARSILDFGCGCGRVLMFMPDRTKAELIGCDVHAAAIDWCNAHLPFARAFVGTANPPMPLKDGSVDILYAVSVLTHLNEDMQRAWLDEWRRVVRKDGLVIASFLGDDYVNKHLANEIEYRQNIEELWRANQGIAFVDNDAWARVFPDFYQTTYHTVDYVKRVWSEYFDILAVKKSGEFSNRQEAVVMRRRGGA